MIMPKVMYYSVEVFDLFYWVTTIYFCFCITVLVIQIQSTGGTIKFRGWFI